MQRWREVRKELGHRRRPGLGMEVVRGVMVRPPIYGRRHRSLPTASTCFNTLRLPPYPSEAELRGKLRVALAGSQGFDEGAVAE